MIVRQTTQSRSPKSWAQSNSMKMSNTTSVWTNLFTTPSTKRNGWLPRQSTTSTSTLTRVSMTIWEENAISGASQCSCSRKWFPLPLFTVSLKRSRRLQSRRWAEFSRTTLPFSKLTLLYWCLWIRTDHILCLLPSALKSNEKTTSRLAKTNSNLWSLLSTTLIPLAVSHPHHWLFSDISEHTLQSKSKMSLSAKDRSTKRQRTIAKTLRSSLPRFRSSPIPGSEQLHLAISTIRNRVTAMTVEPSPASLAPAWPLRKGWASKLIGPGWPTPFRSCELSSSKMWRKGTRIWWRVCWSCWRRIILFNDDLANIIDIILSVDMGC